MKNRGLFVLSFLMAVMSFTVLNSCDIDIGLGAAIDTEVPILTIENPPTDAVIRDAFVISGSYSDDGEISRISIDLRNTENNKSYSFTGKLDDDSNWSADINPLDEKSGIPDGNYEVKITIADKGGHKSNTTRSFTIDNTAPVLVLSRPSSTDKTDESKIESYGQNLTLEGQISDKSDIDRIVMNFYKGDKVYPKVITNIPPTISLDVAKFLDNDIYSKLFGDNIDNIENTEKTFYFTITAYDSAKRYPQESEEDELGNPEDQYILMTDWQTFQFDYKAQTNSEMKLPDLYSIKSGMKKDETTGRYVYKGNNQLISSLFSDTKSKGSFRLNPKNNPTFLISTLSLEETSDVESDQPITVQLFKGLDGIELKDADKMAVYLIPLDDSGKKIEDVKIYPQNQKYENKNGDRINIKIFKDDCKDKSPIDDDIKKANSVSLEYGKNYILGVDGKDIRGNEILPSLDGKEYRICFKAKKQAPGLKIKSPAAGTSYIAKGNSITISGTTSIPDDHPTITITCKKGNDKEIEVYTYKVTDDDIIQNSEENEQDNLIYYNFEYPVPLTGNGFHFEQDESKQYTFEITSELDGWKSSISKTIIYDVDGPTISIDSMLPTAEKYDAEKEDGIPESGSYLNGDVKMKIAILDDYDSVNTEIKDPEDDRRPQFIITDKDDNPIAFRVGNETEKFPVHYISTPTKQEFTIHTEDIPNGKIKVKIFAEDRAGNLGVDIDDLSNTSFVREYIVDQSTDAPVILPYNPASVTLKYATAEDIDNAFATTEDAKEIKSVFTTGSTLQLKLIDDDGIESVTFKCGEKDTDENLEEKTGKTETQAGNPTELMYTYQLPTAIGKFKCSVTVKDTKKLETTKTFWIVTTGAAPVVSITSAKPDNKIITLASENTDENAHKEFSEINLEIDSGYKNFTVSRFEKINGKEEETVLYGNDGLYGKKLTFTSNSTSKTFKDTFKPAVNRSENKIRYVVTDEVGHSGEREFAYNVDNTAPVVDADTIVVPSVQDTEGLSFRFKSGTASDTAPAGEKESGIAKIQFTFDSAKVSANIKTLSGISALNETVLFGDDEYEYAFGSDAKEGKREIYVRAIDEVGNIGSWVEKEFVYDTSKPNLSITSYKQNGTDFVNFADNTTEFDITDEFALGGKVSDDYGIKNFEIWQKKEGSTYENSYGIKLLETANPNKSWTIDKLPRDESNPDNANVDSGSYIYTIVATDKADKSTTKTITANIDITKPIVTFNTATASKMGQGAINSSPFMFSGTVIENTPKISGIYYKVVAKTNPESAVPAAPSSTISELLTASKWTAADWTSVTPEASWSFYRDIATGEPGAIAEGKYYLYMYAVDGAGNVSERAKQEFHVDMASPVITATAPEYVNSLTNASGSAADLRKVVISGTIVETNELLSFTISRNGTTSSITPDENGNWTFIDNPANDGKYTYTIKATDLVGKTDTITKNVTVDTSKPVYTADSLKVGSKNWNSTSYYKDTTLKMSGTYTDATSGIDTLFYYIQYPGRSGQVPADLTAKVNGNIVADGEVSLKANSADSTQYDFNFTVVDYKNNAETPNTLYIQTIDNAGNKSDVKAFTINIDTSAPELTALYYKVGEGTIKEAGGTVYVNGTLPITVYGNYKDAESGAEPLTGFKINGTAIAADVSYSVSAISSATDIPASFASYSSADSKAIRSWKAVFTPAMDGKFEFEGRNGTYDESVSLTGGKTAVNPFKITLDTTGPSISNVSITPSNNTVAYKKTESNGTVNYYVNNQAGTTFTFAGVSADSTGVDTVKLEVFNSDNTKTYSETTRHSEWSFADVDLSALTGTQSAPSKATITVTDIAGNSTTQELRLVFDTTAPKAMHWADSNYKDVYFRIGSGTGGKYSYGSWGNASTIEIRGTFDETGSGLKVIHYAIFDAEPTATQISSFEAGTLTKGGSVKVLSNFAPLSETVTQTVSHSGGSGSKEITTNFDTVLSGFNEEYNYLVLVAEDYVGNRAADTLAVYDGETTGDNKWNSENHNTATAYYRINKDTLAPVISSIEGDETTQTTDVPLTINITDKNPVAPTVVVKAANQTEILNTLTASTPTGSDSAYTSTVTIPFASELTDDGFYDIEVTVKDKADNTSAVFTKRIVRDHVAPTITITKPASESGAFIKSTNYKFEGTITDATCGIQTATAALFKVTGSTEEQVGETEEISLDASGNWVFQAYELEAADYKVKINAADIAGNAAVETVSPIVKIDSIPPVVTVTSTGLNDSTGSAVGLLSNGLTYYAKDSYSIVVSVDDVNFDYSYTKPDTYAKLYEISGTDRNSVAQEITITSSATKAFTFVPSSVSDGLFTYTIKVEDKAGNKADDVIIKVHRDTTGPSVEIKNPGDDITDPKYSLDADTYSFRINANDGSGVGVSNLYYLFSRSATAPASSSESSWVKESFTDGDKIIEMNFAAGKSAQTTVAKTELCEGKWYLHSWAKDKSGNASTVSTRTFSIDKAAPVLSVTQALNEGIRNVITVGSTGYALSGTVSDSNELDTLVLKVDGVNTTITPSSGTAWSTTIATGSDNGKLKSDESVEVELIATDIAGKTTTKKFTLYNDTKNPELEITAPVLNEPVATLGKVIKGTSSDDGYGIDKVEYKLFSGEITSPATEENATVVTSSDKQVTSANFPVEIKGEQWYIKDSTNGMPLGTTQGSLTLKVTAIEKKNGTYGGRSTSKYVPFYFDKANPELKENVINTAGKTTKDGFTLGGKVWDSNAIASLTIKCGNKTWVSGTDSNITITPTTSEPATNNWTATFVVGTTNNNANNYVADGINEFTIIATDSAGKTTQITRTVTVDTQKPEIGTVSFTNQGTVTLDGVSWYKTTSIPVTVLVTEHGLSGISKVEYSIQTGDSVTWSPLSNDGTNYTGTINFAGNGNQTLRLKATDVAGNVSEEVTASVNIDTSAPDLSALYYKKGSDNAKTLDSNLYLKTGTQITVYGNYKDEQSGVENLTFKIGDTAVAPTVTYSTTEIGNGVATIPSDYATFASISDKTDIKSWKAVITPTANGQFTVTGKNRTQIQTSAVGIFTIAIDGTAPTVSIINPAVGTDPINGTNYTFRINADDGDGVGVTKLLYAFGTTSTTPAATTWYEIDFTGGDKNIDMPLVTGKSPVYTNGKVSSICEGDWYVFAKAIDKAGNETATAVSRAFTVDRSIPNLTVSGLNESGVNALYKEISNDKYILSGTASDTNALAATNAVTLSIDGQTPVSATVSGTNWTYDLSVGTTTGTLKADELVSVKVTAKDVTGKTTEKEYTLYHDTKDPELEVTAPVGNEAVEANTKAIKGTVSDGGYGIKKLEYKLYRGTALIASGDTEHSDTDYPLTIKGEQWYISKNDGKLSLGNTEGELTLEVTATENQPDGATVSGARKYVTTKTVNFYYDSANPEVTESEVGSTGKTTNGGAEKKFSLLGTASDLNALESVTINWKVGTTNKTITLTPTASQLKSMNWSQEFVVGSTISTAANYVADGTNEFTIIAKDITGKTKQITRTVTVDTGNPSITMPSVSPESTNGWYNTRTLTVSGSASDEGTGIAKVEYSFDENTWIPLLVSGTNYSGSIMFDSDGTGKQITVKATDVAGNTDTKKIENIQIDSERPSISSITGAETTQTTDVVLTINITDKNPVAPTVEVKAANSTTVLKTPTASIPTGSDSTYTSTVTIPFASELTDDGFYDIEVTVKDKADNTSAVFTKRIVRDHVAPTITITKPASESGAFIKATNYKFEGTITDATCGIQTATAALFKVTGSTEEQVGETEEISLDASGNWVFQAYELEAADYKVKINATDIAGNTATETESSIVKIDSVPPKVTVSSTGLNDSTGNNVGPLSNGLTYYAKGNYSIVVSVDDINFDYSYIKPGTSAGKLYEVTGTDRNSTTQALTITSGSAKAFTFVPSSVSDGLFTYTIKVEDKAGNKADDVIIKVHRDTTGPSVEIKNPTADITDPKKSLDADTYSFRINANDGSGVGVSFLYYLFSTSATAPATSSESSWVKESFTDGDKIIEMDFAAGKSAQTSVAKTELCEGKWYLHSWAKDKSGNASTVSTRTFSIDKAAPVLFVTQALNEGSRNVITVGSTGYALSGTVSDSNELDTLVLKVDGVNTTITPASGTAWSTTIAIGSDNGKLKSDESVEVELIATDIAGKTTTKKFTLYNDTKNPELEITAPVLNEPVATLGKVIKGTSSDDGYGIDKVEYKLYSGVVNENTENPQIIKSGNDDITSANFPVEIKGEQWYIKDSTNGMPLGATEGQLTLKVTATEKTNGTYGGRSTSKYVPFYFDKANPNLEETGVGTTGKTTNTTFTLSGTASDSNALQSVTINWKVGETDKSVTLNPTTENWSQEFVVGTANSSANNYVADGANEFTIIATDITGKTKQLTRTVTVDTQEPTVGDITVTTTGTTVGTATWYKTSNIEVTVAVTENGLSGISKVEYQAEDGTWTPLSFINNKYQGTIRFTGDGAKTFKIKATDVAGNVSEEATASVNIDTSAPELSVLYYKKGTGDAQSIISPVYLQSGTQITVYGNYKDEQSGVKALAFKLGSASVTPTVTYSTTAIENSAPVDSNYTLDSTAIASKETTIRSWKAVFTPSASGAFVVTGDNRTTNPTSEITIFDITIDDTAPTVQIKTPATDITDGKNALNGTTYTFSVNASDGSGVGVTSLQYAFSKTSTSPAATEWETIDFAGGDKSIEMPLIEGTTETRSSGKVTKLCEGTWYLYVKATDKAGNVNTTPVKRTFKVDMAAPTLTIPSTIQEGKRNVISSEVGTNGYVLSGTVSDTNALTSLVLKVDNVETTITPASGTAWTATIAKGTTDGKLKSDEAVEVELIATDIAGKTTTKNFILYYDTKDPELEITAPVADEPVETDGKVIKGTVSDDGYGIDKVEYKLYSGVVTSENESTATVVTSDTNQVTSTNFPVEIKGEQWYIKTSTGMPLGTAEGSLTLKVTATEKKNGTYGGRSTSKYVSFYFDKANPNLDETGIGSAGKTTNGGTEKKFSLSGTASDSNALESITIKWKVGEANKERSLTPTSSQKNLMNWSQEFVVGSTNSTAANYVADGTNEFTIIAKDISGKEKQLTRTVIVDTVAPTCGTPSITSTGKTVGTGDDAKTWYKTSFIDIKLENVKDENGTGISKVEYTTETGDSAKWYPMSGSGTTYTATVNCISQGENSIRVKVTDAAGTAGNEKMAGTLTAYIDTKAPTLGTSKVKYLSENFDAVSELLINASNGYQLQIEASDTEDETADDYSGIASVTYSYGSKTIAGTKPGNYWIIEVPITGNGTNNYSDTKTNAIYAIIKDNAGNEIKERILTVTKDTTDPKVEIVSFTRAGSKTDGVDDVNGTITISGTASDTNKFGSVKLEYQKSGGTSWTEIATKTDNSWTTTLNTKTLDDNTKYTIKATAIDAAGNTKAVTQDVYVNQDSDRPVITVTNMSLATAENETSFLKRTSRLEGTVSDDDGNVSKLEYSTNGTSWTEATLEYGTAWSIPDLPEGDNKLYFRVTDKVNTTPFTTAVEVESATAEAANQPKIKDQNNTYVSHIQGSLALKFKVVTKQPDVDAKQYQVFNSSTNAWETRETLGTLGGIFTKFKISLKAKSEAFIGAVQAKYATGNYDINFTCVDTNYSDKEYHTWTSTEIALDASKTEIKLKISDASSTTDPMTLEQTITYAVDNTTPEITIKEPASTVGVKETMQFDIKEEAVTYYAVTKNDVTANAQTGAPDSENIAWTQIEDTSNGLTRYVFFDDDINVKDHTDRFALYLTEATTEKPNRLSITTVAAIESTTNPFETITKVKFWVKAVDNCGNIGYASKEVNVDPQGNRPTVTLGYPANVLKDGVSVVPTLGGTIRLDGNVSDDIAAKYVWVKIERENAAFSGADIKFLKEKGYLIGDMTTNELLADATITALADDASVPNYAIRVPVSGTGWNLSINNNQEFNVANNEAHLKFKIYATDADQDKVDPNIKHIHRSAEITQQIVIDSRTPYISASELRLVKYENGSTSDQQYNDGASVHGIWYLQGKIRDDDSGLKTVQFKKNSDTTYTDVITAVGQNIDKYNNDSHFYFKKIDHTDNSTAQVKKYDYEFSVPLGNSTSGQVGTDTITIKAIEATDQNLYVEQTYSVTYDNKAPEFNTDTENPFVKLASEIYNSSGFYTFGAIASEDAVEIDNKTVNQSGVERIAFYFTRDLDYGLNELDSDVYTDHSGTSTHDLFDVMIYHSNVDAADVNSGNMIVGYQSGLTYSNGLYWRSYSGTSSGKTFTYTNASVDPNIHAGGLVKIGGVIYKIESVSGQTISVASNISGTSADFALCNVIDKGGEKNGTSVSSNHGYGFGYYPSRSTDDGDLITETFNSQGTSYIFDASINSKNLPDGPITLHMIAFDKAGNVTEPFTMTGTVKNNAPRIAGLILGTDENGNGSVDEEEFVSAYSGKYNKGYDTTGNEMHDVKFPVISAGQTQTSLLTVKGLTVVKPEIIGGNGAISYSYKVGSKAAVEGGNLKKDGSTDNINGTTDDVVTGSITLPVSAFIGTEDGKDNALIPDGELSEFKFTFGDSTPGTSLTDTTGKNSATMTVYLDVALRETNKAKNWILPFYWKSKTDNSLFKQSADEGHVELAADWVTTTSYTGTTGEYDADPKVSGKIKIEGIAQDDTLLREIKVQFGKSMGGMTTADTTIATYDFASGKWGTVTGIGESQTFTAFGASEPATIPDSGWVSYVKQATYQDLLDAKIITAMPSDKEASSKVPYASQNFGHVVHWILYLDTAKVAGVAATDVTVTATATDRGTPKWNGTTSAVAYTANTAEVTGKPATGDTPFSAVVTKTVEEENVTITTGALTGNYRVDVVPYITEVVRGTDDSTKPNKFNTNRARSGAVSLRRGDVLNKIKGFNLNGDSVSVKITPNKNGSGTAVTMADVTAGNDITFTVSDSTTSGYLQLEVNNIAALNNINGYIDYNTETNAKAYDHNTLTDDRYVHIWRVSQQDTFKGSKNAVYPAMARGSDGTLYASFTNYGQSKVYYTKSFIGNDSVTASAFTGVKTSGSWYNTTYTVDDAIQTSNDNANGVATLFWGYDPPEETDIAVGSKGEVNVFYAANYHGGNDTNWDGNSPTDAGGIYVYDTDATATVINGQTKQAKIYRSELYTYDNELNQFKNLRITRSENYIYLAYYDRLRGSIKTTVINDATGGRPNTATNGLPWITLDGDSDNVDKAGTGYSFAGGWTPFLNTNYGNGVSARTSATGESVAITTNSSGYPVVFYMDAETGCLRIATASTASPTTANDWRVQGVFSSTDDNYDTASDYLSCLVDSQGYLHIAFQNTKGQLVYAKSTNNPSNGTTAYSFGSSEVLDDSGMYIDMTMNGTTPYISYLSRVNSYDGMKIAFKDSNFDENNDGVAEGGWETMTAALNEKVTTVRTCIEPNAKAYDTNSYTAAVGFCPGLDYRAAFYVGQ